LLYYVLLLFVLVANRYLASQAQELEWLAQKSVKNQDSHRSGYDIEHMRLQRVDPSPLTNVQAHEQVIRYSSTSPLASSIGLHQQQPVQGFAARLRVTHT